MPVAAVMDLAVFVAAIGLVVSAAVDLVVVVAVVDLVVIVCSDKPGNCCRDRHGGRLR